MKTNTFTSWNQWLGRAAASLVAIVLFAACDSASGLSDTNTESDNASIAASISTIMTDLSLSSSESAALRASFAKFGDGDDAAGREPGFLWRVAAELHATLSDEQKAKLYERIEEAGRKERAGAGSGGQGGQGMQGQRPGQGGQGGPGMRPSQGGHGGQAGQGGPGLSRIDLTDAQQEQIAVIREAYKPQIEAVLEQKNTLSRAEIKAALEAIYEAVRGEVEALLTDEQKQALAELKAEAEARRAEMEAERDANREASKLVMIEVLGLSTDQVVALDQLHSSGAEDRAAIEALVESGADREEVMAAVEALRDAHQAELSSILDVTQYEITLIHGAISSRMKKGGQGGPGQKGPGQNVPGGRPGQGGPGQGGPGQRLG